MKAWFRVVLYTTLGARYYYLVHATSELEAAETILNRDDNSMENIESVERLDWDGEEPLQFHWEIEP